jgi:hypothetical protein
MIDPAHSRTGYEYVYFYIKSLDQRRENEGEESSHARYNTCPFVDAKATPTHAS